VSEKKGVRYADKAEGVAMACDEGVEIL